ncbi:MAG: PmbA protein [Actinomycetota bacterium]|nr:PmbA protein [Actinomycetota bacterium]
MPLPLSEEAARSAARAILEIDGADDVEVVVSASESGLTRYANSEIIQNTVRKELRASVRVVTGGRIASATTNQLDADSMRRAAERALEAARSTPVDEEFPGLARPEDVGRPQPIMRFDEDTASSSPAARARAVEEILGVVGDGSAAGIYETGAHAYAVFSSTGVDCFDAYSRCSTTCLVDLGDGTGWGEASSYRSADVEVTATARRALKKAGAGAGKDADPGTYEVVLEPSAVATLIDYLSFTGFGAKQMIEGESFLASKQGVDVAVPEVTISDDAVHEQSVGISFDFEGVPKKRVAVIDEGKAIGPVTDLRTAKRLDTTSTGHASGSDEFGPYASNVVMGAGDKSLEELIGGIEDGFLVTRFHYVNVLDRPATLLTGMTRDGTFRIRGGELAEAVHNFRFAQSVLDAFKSTRAVGKDLYSFAPDYSSFGSSVAPAIHVGEFHFASRTSH